MMLKPNCDRLSFPSKTREKKIKIERLTHELNVTLLFLALINRAGGLYGRILTEIVSTDRTQ